MKILLYSSVFWPSLGGIETITATLAENIIRLGHECTVVTETNSSEEDFRSYAVIRKPSLKERIELTRQCDLVHSNGASVAMYPFARLTKKPFIWTHNGYQVSCVDGLGWLDGEPSPMSPVPSLIYHFYKRGFVHFLKESFKLAVRRYVATRVELNIAATQWIAKRQPLPNQVVAYTPYPIGKFKRANKLNNYKYDFIYVGRLVSEKGLPELIQAFHCLVSTPRHQDKTLAIVGEGNIKPILKKMAMDLKLSDSLFFLGSKHGSELVDIVHQAKVGVVPSAYEEPMGGVSLELLAGGKNVIVSEYGGHAECIGDAGLKFKNGEANSLFECMVKILEDKELATQQLKSSFIQLSLFDEVKLTRKYIDLYESVIKEYSQKLFLCL